MISAVVLTKNEEKNIYRCLHSLSFCREIIVVDDYSTDQTLKIVKKFTSKIFLRKLMHDFSKQRNFALTKVEEEWVLFIDADEFVPEPLKDEIVNTIRRADKTINGYFIKREDIFLGKRMHYGELGNIRLLRLARKNKGLWVRPVHEVWQIAGKIEILKNPLIHISHQTVKEFLNKINYYSTINARYLFDLGVDCSFKDIIIYPGVKFFLNFFVKRGFMDGFYGFIHAGFMSLHSFLTRAKLYLLNYAKKD